MSTGKSQPEGPPFQWEPRQASFPTGTVDPRVGSFMSPLNTNNNSTFLVHTGSRYPYVYSPMVKSMPCGIHVGQALLYSRQPTRNVWRHDVPNYWITSVFYVCDVGLCNSDSNFQTSIAPLFDRKFALSDAYQILNSKQCLKFSGIAVNKYIYSTIV